jgi:hypothetical protein
MLDYDPPDVSHSMKGLEIWYFPIAITDGAWGLMGYHGLMLVAKGTREGEYRRIGYFVTSTSPCEVSISTLPGNVYMEIVFYHRKAPGDNNSLKLVPNRSFLKDFTSYGRRCYQWEMEAVSVECNLVSSIRIPLGSRYRSSRWDIIFLENANSTRS